MKVQFVFNGRKYIASSKQEAYAFLNKWDGWSSRVHRLRTNWKIKGVELAPGWVPIAVFDDDRIEYEKV